MKDLIIRSISGLLYISVIISSALFSDLSFILVVFVFCSIVIYEFQKIINHKSPVPFIIFSLIVYQFYNQNLHPYLHFSLLGIGIGVNLLLTYFLFSKKQIRVLAIQKSVLTIFYIVASSYFIISTCSFETTFENGISLSMYLLVWVNNSFAYIFGRKWGKKLLFPNVSPNKTWEGCLGGTLMCFLVGFILISYYPKYHMLTFPFLALIISATSVIGDLIQSKFKRQAAIKDSGYIIPWGVL